MINKLFFLFTFLLFVSGCFADEPASTKPIRLVITGETISFDGKLLSFKDPLNQWIEVLGEDYVYIGENPDYQKAYNSSGSDRFVYPKLGIDIEVQFNNSDVKSEFIDGKPGTLKDPYNRFVSIIRIRMNPESKADPGGARYIGTERANHTYYTMHADYAIDFYGAIVDSDTSIESVLSQSNIVKRNRKFHSSIGVYSGYENLGKIVYNHFFGEQPEVSMSMQVWPTLELRLENERKYFGKVVSR
ncbi:hypothetical protein RN22_23890 [Grimontia sp. AD028]|uniref:DUF7738 domain-containing protein n=1 Tax=Grimontia sp. AD028 TaxID=1581149 RepID=UPI00061ABB32|nr:hypothetical protein [Grimontia sp. AD028]KKD57909.1 hypothetical protein RN22_23890 [Grimontia sp. AD028]